MKSFLDDDRGDRDRDRDGDVDDGCHCADGDPRVLSDDFCRGGVLSWNQDRIRNR